MKEGWTKHPLGSPPTIIDKIVEVATYYLGQKEFPGNMGFESPVFEKKLKSVAWEEGQAWCAHFAELVWKEAYEQFYPDMIPVLEKLFSGSAVKTWVHFSKDKQFICNKAPQRGCVVIWQYYKDGKPDWRGHAGIVTFVYANRFISIEGNSNSSGGREGIEVAIQKRMVEFDTKDGLRLKGFIHPVDPEILT